MFLSRLSISIESKYWSIELKITELVWVLRKIRHLIKFIKTSTIIYVNHEVSSNIVKQISFIISSTDKLNLRLVRVSNYIQRFFLKLRHKSEKFYIVSDVLSRLFSTNSQNFDEKELNVLYTAFLAEISFEFQNRIRQNYKKNSNWNKINNTLNKSENTTFFFIRKDNLIYRKEIDTNITFYVSQRICTFLTIPKNIFNMIHDVNDYFNFDRIYVQIVFF